MRVRLGWKNGGTEIQQHPWFKKFDWQNNTDHVQIFTPEYKDPLYLDYLDTDEVFLCKFLAPFVHNDAYLLDDNLESTDR